MRLRLRLLWIILSSLWRKPLGMLDESVLTLRVLPNDIDVTKITDDRYSALMDLGRMDLVCRFGYLKLAFRKRWVPVALFNAIRFRYPLRVFQKYRLRTRIVYWDDEAFYFQQLFERKGRVVATAYVCATGLGAHGRVSPKEVIEELHIEANLPVKPEIVSQIQGLNNMIHAAQKEYAWPA